MMFDCLFVCIGNSFVQRCVCALLGLCFFFAEDDFYVLLQKLLLLFRKMYKYLCLNRPADKQTNIHTGRVEYLLCCFSEAI